jgi:two-component system CheB/CheR fusion protein
VPLELKQGKFRRDSDTGTAEGTSSRRRAAAQARELAETRDYLQAIQEENESATEELQASNEEMTSANEELQSLNEELETSKEELESTNEELTTVNEEMTHRNSDLLRLNNDLNNFHASVSMAIIRLDRRLTIQHFTPQAEKLFNLMTTDIGRPIGGIKHNLDLPDLDALLAGVIESGGIREREVRDKDGHWYSLRVRPYITVDKKIDGVVLVLIDIDDMKRLEDANQRSRRYAESVVQTVPPLLVLDDQLIVKTINRSYCSTFGILESEALNHSVFDLFDGQGDIPRMRSLFEGVLKRNEAIQDFEVSHKFKNVGLRTMLLSARMVEYDGRPNILLCINDVTDRKHAEETLRAASQAKDEFLATLAHELRNPLAPIRNSLEIMQHTGGDPAMIEEARVRILRQMNKMVQLVDDLMDISRISRGKVVLRKRHLVLSEIIKDVVETARAMPESAGREIMVKMPAKPSTWTPIHSV